MANSGDNAVLNTLLLTAVVGVAGFIGVNVVQQGQVLSGIQSTLADHSKYFDELIPIIKDAAVMTRRLDDQDKRDDRIEAHLDATDKRVDSIVTANQNPASAYKWSPH